MIIMKKLKSTILINNKIKWFNCKKKQVLYLDSYKMDKNRKCKWESSNCKKIITKYK